MLGGFAEANKIPLPKCYFINLTILFDELDLIHGQVIQNVGKGELRVLENLK